MRRRAGVIGVATVVLGGGLSGGFAWATETSTASAALSVSTATLQPPGPVTLTVNCPNRKKGDVLVTWTASPSTFIGGYTVTRAGGPVSYPPVSLTPTATSYDDTSVTGATTYTYTVTATYLGWSAAATPVSVTTAAKC